MGQGGSQMGEVNGQMETNMGLVDEWMTTSPTINNSP